MATAQELRHLSVRDITGTTRDYNSDWLQLFIDVGFETGTFNERLLRWINQSLGTTHTSLPGAMQAYAEWHGFDNWSSMGDFDGALPEFAYESEASAYIDDISSAPSDGRKYEYNKLFRRLKSAGLYDKINAGWLLRNADEQSSLLDIKGNFTATKQASPVHTANTGGWSANASASNYLDTGWNPSAQGVDEGNFHFCVYTGTAAQSANSELGHVNGSSQGISIACRNTSNKIVIRANSAQITSTANNTDGAGFFIVSVSGTTIKIFQNGELFETITDATLIEPVDSNLYLLKPNGGANPSARSLTYFGVGTALTDAEAKEYYAIIHAWMEHSSGGFPDIHEAGYQPAEVTADVVVYGTTTQGIIAAYEATRQGQTAIIVGGWRDYILGGASANGTPSDIDTLSSIGGLPRLVITRLNAEISVADTTANYQPHVVERILRRFLDSARTDGLDVPIYYSRGVTSVQKSGTTITSFRTADGRRFIGSQFIDCSYEGDLLARAGCSYIVGREAAGSGEEVPSGERGTATTENGGQSQYSLGGAGGTFYNIDPYIEEGNAASGLLAGVNEPSGAAVGTADSKIQSYNFRRTVTNLATRKQTHPTAPPAGYDIANYEPLLRFFAAIQDDNQVYGTDWTLDGSTGDSILLFREIATGFYGINQSIGMGPNYWAQSWNYPEASYAAREVIWKAHEAWDRGLWYTLTYGRTNEGDTRIPAALETAARGFGFDRRLYCDPHPNDDIWWPGQMYVRQARRLVGDFIYDANDLAGTDGEAPRSTKTIGCASYNIDPHHVEAIADPNSGNPRIWNTGMVVKDVNGANNLSPLPYEIILPKVAECTNLTAPFCVSATHLAFGAIRMEFATSSLAQAAGLAATLAIEEGTTIQAVDYTDLRTRLLASNTLTDELDPVIPQTN